ncbi:MAG: YCF48-related protein [Saprospiraceae bacterium]|nr:YCF48-related protein [Saprospiraceae bacterium]
MKIFFAIKTILTFIACNPKQIILFLSLLISSVTFGQWVSLTSGTNNNLYDIDFPTSNIGFVAGANGMILKTTDAGQIWVAMNTGTNTDFYGIVFLDADTGFVVGDAGLFKTINGGTSWTTVAIPTSQNLRDITFVNNQVGFCTGGNGTIIKTIDGGDTWAVKTTTATRTISSIQFPSANIGYAVQTGYNWEFLKTNDGGDNWTKTSIGPISNLSSLEAVHFTDTSKGFVGGWYLSAFVTTQDGGNTWSNVSTSISPQVYDIYFPSPAEGYMVGWYGEIYHSIDSGTTWTAQQSGYTNSLRSIYSTDSSIIYIVGEQGLILKSSSITNISPKKYQEKQVKLFPNPCHDLLIVELTTPIDATVCLSIYNALGEELLVHPVSKTNKIEVDLSLFAKGIYTYSLNTKEKLIKTGMIVKH